MLKLIKDGAVIDNPWVRFDSDANAEDVANAEAPMVSLDYWNQHRADLQPQLASLGIWIDSHEDPALLSGNWTDAAVIAVNIPKIADGRGFSIARMIRERYQYQGELRAIGAPTRDQLTYLVRVGFSAFELAPHYEPDAALASLSDFSEAYQTSVERPVPLFNRRSG